MADTPKVFPPWWPKRDPWHPPDYDERVIHAVRALERGQASQAQQLIAWRWLMYVTGVEEMPYRPGGTDGERDTTFALGRHFVGFQLRKMLHPEITPPAPETVGAQPMAGNNRPKKRTRTT